MSNDGTVRVRYFAKQFLRAEDFTDEQAYHVAMRRRHNISHHVWGIASGLALQSDDAGTPFVMPGLAVDGYGRELVLPVKQALPLAEFEEKDTDVLDVWLEYDRLASEPAPRGYVDCGAGTSSSPYRWQERPLVRMTIPDPAFSDRRRPQTVPDGDLDFDPERLPPDDPQQDWPVFLGRIERRRSSPTQPYTYSFDLADRPYVGLIGERVSAASRRALVQVGAEKKDDHRRFAVFVRDRQNQNKADEPVLAIDTNGNTTIEGDTTVRGGLTIAEGALHFVAGEAVTSPRPWSIYQSFEPAQTSAAGNPPQDSDLSELRIELPAAAPGPTQVAIGHWSEEENRFHSCLTVAANGGVIVHGNLVIEGTLDEQQQSAAAVFSEDAKNSFVSAQFSGVAGANVILPTFYESSFPTVTRAVHATAAATQLNKRVANFVTLLKDPTFFDSLVEEIKKETSPELSRKLREALKPPEG